MSIPDFYFISDHDFIDLRPAKRSLETLTRMTIEIEGGVEFGSPQSKIPNDEPHRVVWRYLAQEIEEMHAAGLSVDIPFDW